MTALEQLSRRQASWSRTANGLKGRLDTVRWTAFAFSIGGAALATVASQFDGGARQALAIVASVLLAVVSFLTAHFAGQAQVAGWVRARAAAEALKREAFRFATRAAPYDGADAEDVLARETERVEEGVDDLLDRLQETDQPGSAPVGLITPADYLAQRIEDQALRYYKPKANDAQRMAKRLRAIEFVLALAAAVLTAISAGLPKQPVGGGMFDVTSLTAVLTTVAALILAHIEAMRFDFIAVTYRATARRLENARGCLKTLPAAPSPEWSAFVETCETIIATENGSWAAKWSGR